MDLIALDGAALHHLGRLVETLTMPQLAAPTPCAGWNVGDLVDHMNREHEAISAEILGTSIALEPDPRSAFTQAVARWRAAFSQPGLLDREVFVAKYQARYPGRQVLSVHLADMLVHHWDIGKAIGVEPELPADLVAVAVPVARALPPDGPLRGAGRTYAPPVPVHPDASPLDLLVAALGRSPSWHAHEETTANPS